MKSLSNLFKKEEAKQIDCSKKLADKYLSDVSGANGSFARHDKHVRDSVGGSDAYWKSITSRSRIE